MNCRRGDAAFARRNSCALLTESRTTCGCSIGQARPLPQHRDLGREQDEHDAKHAVDGDRRFVQCCANHREVQLRMTSTMSGPGLSIANVVTATTSSNFSVMSRGPSFA